MAHNNTSHSPPQFWQNRGFIACLLWPFSLLFGLVASIRRCRLSRPQRVYKAPVPVVIVGNLIVGGAGKTPTLMALIAHLQKLGYSPGVISRGYGRTDETQCLEVTNMTPPELAGDEPSLIQKKTNVPVFVAAQRVQAIKALLEHYPQTDIIVADDGLQHYALARDIEIIVFDERGAGNGFLLPAGPLREPLSRVQSQNLVLFNAPVPSVDLAGFLVRRTLAGWLPLQQWSEAKGHITTWQDLSSLRQKQPELEIAAAAGIGNPERFFRMLKGNDLTLLQTLAFADHDDFKQAESQFSEIKADLILVTEKDATKCLQVLSPALQNKIGVIGLDYQPEKAFFAKFDKMLSNICN